MVRGILATHKKELNKITARRLPDGSTELRYAKTPLSVYILRTTDEALISSAMRNRVPLSELQALKRLIVREGKHYGT